MGELNYIINRFRRYAFVLFCLFNLGWCPKEELEVKDVVLHWKEVEIINDDIHYTNIFIDHIGNTYVTHERSHYKRVNEGDTCKLIYGRDTNVIYNIYER